MDHSIFVNTSYSGLNDAEKKVVSQVYSENYIEGKPVKWDFNALSKERKHLGTLSSYYADKIAQTNPYTFRFLKQAQKKNLEQELQFGFYLLCAQLQLDEAEHRRQGLKQQNEQILHCARLLHALHLSEQPDSPEKELAELCSDSEKHLKFLGLTTVAPFLTEKMTELTTGKTVVTKNWMNEVNGRRLYWVWGGGMLASVLCLLPDDFYNKSQTQWAVSAPSPVTGYMSWVLYYTRFGINLGLLIKHTLAGPWMSSAEKEISTGERFKTQWNLRKFSLLNDFIWATANLACFFWLIGDGFAGYLGNVATAALLLMDVCLTVWRYSEEIAEYNQQIIRFEKDERRLREKIASPAQNKEQVLLELNELLKAKKMYEFEWKYKKAGTWNDLVYAVGLLLAFGVYACFLVPPTAVVAATSLMFGAIGAVLCFTANFISSAYAGYLEVQKSQELGRLTYEDGQNLLKQFLELQNEKNPDENSKKLLFLDIKQSVIRGEYQEKVIALQKMKLIRTVLVDALIPPLIFVGFMFMPFAMALSVVAAGIALAIFTNYVLNHSASDEEKLPKFNEPEYQNFLAKPRLENLAAPKVAIKASLFSEKTRVEDTINQRDLLPPIAIAQ